MSGDDWKQRVAQPMQVVLSNLGHIADQLPPAWPDCTAAASDALAALQRLRSEIDALIASHEDLQQAFEALEQAS
jgi:hypothetical protein